MENKFTLRTTYCSQLEGFPVLLHSCTLRLGIPNKPEYTSKEYKEEGVEKCSMVVYIGKSKRYPQHPPLQITAIGTRYADTYQIAARKALRRLCQTYEKEIGITPLRYFPPTHKTSPIWKERLQVLAGTKPGEDDPTVVHLANYLHTLDYHCDNLASHSRHLSSRVTALEAQLKKMKEEKASLTFSLKAAESREEAAWQAWKEAKENYAKKLKRCRESSPKKRCKRQATSKGCQTEDQPLTPIDLSSSPEHHSEPSIPEWNLEDIPPFDDIALSELDDLLKEFCGGLEDGA